MTAEQILPFAEQNLTFPNEIVLTFKNNTQWIGFFNTDLSKYYNTKSNKWGFVKLTDKENIVEFDGDDVVKIEYTIVPL